jgi:hypothetical protein
VIIDPLRALDMRLTDRLRESLARISQKLDHIASLVVGIGPWHRHPDLIPKRQCHFCIDAVAKINPMLAILGRGQDEFGHAQVARIDVHQTQRGLGVLSYPLRSPGVFPSVRIELVVRESTRVIRIGKEGHLLAQARSLVGW